MFTDTTITKSVTTLRIFVLGVNAVPACRSAQKENRVPEWKTGGAIFISVMAVA
jgi:hypothetical protein